LGDRLREVRAEKLAQLRELGIDPFGSRFDGAVPLAEIRAAFNPDAGPDAEPARVRAAGRIMAKRGHGKSSFLDIQDRTGRMQANVTVNSLGKELYGAFRLMDIGDIVGLEGEVKLTRTGEITIFADSLRLLSKSLLPLPEKWHGLTDVEARFRHRSVDLIMNPEVKDRFLLRSRIIAEVRRYFESEGYIEVETPMMQPIPGGAVARPFVTHHNALGLDLYMRVAPELYLKRLLVGGLERVYEIGRCYRNEGIDRSHNPEFTQIELYEAYADYERMMELCEGVYSTVAEKVLGTTKVLWPTGDAGGGDGGATVEIDLAPPWRRAKFKDLIREFTGVDPDNEGAVRDAAGKLDPEHLKLSHDACLDVLFGEHVEEKLIQPTFVTHQPASLTPLCRRSPDDDTVSERFEPVIAGMEAGNAYTEINDPLHQREEFERQLEALPAEETSGRIDEDFLTALEHGMPPAGGMGIGIDRMVMVLSGVRSIREVVLFPLLRPADGRSGPEGEVEG